MKPQFGFTLIETMLALSLSLVLMSAAMVMLTNAQHTAAALAVGKRAQENQQLAFALIERAVSRAGNFGCAHPQRPLVKMLRGDWAQLPEYDVTRPIAGYNALPRGGLAPNPAATLPLSGAGGDRNVHYAGHGIDLDKLAPQTDILVVRTLGPWSPLGAANAGTAPLVVLGEGAEFAVSDVVLVADCDQATMFKITAIETMAGRFKLSWAAGSGRFDNADGGVVQGLTTFNGSNAAASGGFGADAIVARVETLFFYLAPSRVINRQGIPATALWLKFGPAKAVELIAGIDDLQIWFLAAADDATLNHIGYFDAQHLPVDARVVGVRVYMRSSSVHGVGEFADTPLSVSGVRTFMLPQFVRQAWPL